MAKQAEELGRVCYKENNVKKHTEWMPISQANAFVAFCNKQSDVGTHWVESKRDHESEAWEQHKQSQTGWSNG